MFPTPVLALGGWGGPAGAQSTEAWASSSWLLSIGPRPQAVAHLFAIFSGPSSWDGEWEQRAGVVLH